MDIASVCVYCASSPGSDPRFGALARRTGALLAEAGIRLVYGGGAVGLMGAVADGALDKGGEVIGVMPRRLFRREVAHERLTRLIDVASMHERKQTMFELADAFVALPGGLGTFEELLETATWGQLGLHAKPMVTLDLAGYWAPFHGLLANAVAHGLMKADSLDLVVNIEDPEDLLDALARYRAPYAERFVQLAPEET